MWHDRQLDDVVDPPAPGADFGSAPKLTGRLSLVLISVDDVDVTSVIREANDQLAKFGREFEIVVVCTSAEAHASAKRAAAALNSVRPVICVNCDYATGLRSGVEAATGQWIVVADACGRVPLAQLDRLLVLAHGHEVVCGYRVVRQLSPMAKFAAWGKNWIASLLTGAGVRDVACPLVLFRRKAIPTFPSEGSRDRVHAELLGHARLAGQVVAEVAVTEHAAPGDRSQAARPIRRGLADLAGLGRFWWNTVRFPEADVEPAAPPAQSAAEPSLGSERWSLFVLCALAAIVFFSNLSYPFFEPDETRNGQIALEMFRSGNYITMTHRGEPYLDKPPLMYWLTTLSCATFGESRWAIRLPVAVASFATVLCTYLLGRKLIGRRAAWVGALLLMLSPAVIVVGRYIIMDALLMLFMTVALLAAYLGREHGRRRAAWWTLAGVALGLGIMTKGPVALVLALPPLIAVTWLESRRVPGRWWHWTLLLGLALAVAVPWFAVVTITQDGYAEYFFWKHNVIRYVSAFNHEQPWWFYLPVIFAGMFPGSLLVPGLAALLSSRAAPLRRLRTRQLGFLLLAAVWIIVFFSLSSCKLPTYVLPALPLLCLAVGRLIDGVLLPDAARRLPASQIYLRKLAESWPQRLGILLAGCFVLASVAGLALGVASSTDWMLGAALTVAALGGLVLMLRLRNRTGNVVWLATTGVAVALSAYSFNYLLPTAATLRSRLCAAVAEAKEIRDRDRATKPPVIVFGDMIDSASLNSAERDLPQFDIDQIDDLAEYVRDNGEVLIIIRENEVDELRNEIPWMLNLTDASDGGYLYRLSIRSPGDTPIRWSPTNRAMTTNRNRRLE